MEVGYKWELLHLLRLHGLQPDPERPITSDPLIECMISLLARLGEVVNRKIFVPGETREQEMSRHLFIIVSGTMKLLMGLSEKYPKLCRKKVEELQANLNDKDWELYNNTNKSQSCEGDPQNQTHKSTVNHRKGTSMRGGCPSTKKSK
jgi:hypothetical protein